MISPEERRFPASPFAGKYEGSEAESKTTVLCAFHLPERPRFFSRAPLLKVVANSHSPRFNTGYRLVGKQDFQTCCFASRFNSHEVSIEKRIGRPQCSIRWS